MKRVFLLLLLFFFGHAVFGNVVLAQFYDSADEINFYRQVDSENECFVVNFNGERATCFQTYNEHSGSYNVNGIMRILAEDPNHFENAVNDAWYRMIFSEKFTEYYSETSYILALRYSNGYTTEFLFTFSDDKSVMYKRFLTGSSRVLKFERVPKNFFLPGRK